MFEIGRETSSLVTRGEYCIQAPIEIVWWLASDFENWPTWQPNVQFASISGDLEGGTRFFWNSGGVPVTSVVLRCEKPSALSWRDRSLGIESLHVWEFQDDGTGTKVLAAQTWSGWPDPVMQLAASHFLDHSLHRSMAALKRRAERLSSGLLPRRTSTLPA